jgi:hypothetical protein
MPQNTTDNGNEKDQDERIFPLSINYHHHAYPDKTTFAVIYGSST